MNSLKILAKIFRRPRGDMASTENKIAYEEGWRSEDTGEKNPHAKGSPQHQAWEKGAYDRGRNEMLIW